MNIVSISIILVCLAVSFVCSGMEAGVMALSRWRIRQQARDGRRRAKVLMGYLERPESFLWTILVANTLAAFVALGILVFELYQHLRGRPGLSLAIFLGSGFLFYALCDLFPKLLFRMFPNRLCMAVAVPFQLINAVMSPLTGIIQSFSDLFLKYTGGKAYTGQVFKSRTELRQAMQESSGGLTREERVMIGRVLDLQQVTVAQLMRPFSQLPAAHAQMTGAELIRTAQELNRNFLPVWDDASQKRIAGVVDFKSLLYGPESELEKKTREHVLPALYVSDHLLVEEALRRLQRSGQPLAVVLGADRRELGIIGLEEIMSAIFGEVKT